MKNRILLGLILLLIGVGGIFLWLKTKVDSIKEDTNNSTTLSQNIKNLFSESNALYEYPFQNGKIEWNNQYLVLEKGGNSYYDVLYRTELNKTLGVHKFFPGDNVNGIILLVNGSIVKGIYEDTDVEAKQLFYELNYIDLSKKQILRKDTVFGPLPKEYIRKNDKRGFVDHPSNEKIISKIKEVIN